MTAYSKLKHVMPLERNWKKCIQTLVPTGSRKTLAPPDICSVPTWDIGGPSPHFKDEETEAPREKVRCPEPGW